MIPARGHYEARFKYDPTKPSSRNPIDKRVEAFNEEGVALIVNEEGFLVPAMSYSTFLCVVDLNGEEVIGVLPGAGWRLAWTDPDDGEVFTHVVVGWSVKANGETHPIIADGLGAEADIWTDPENVKLLPPASEVS